MPGRIEKAVFNIVGVLLRPFRPVHFCGGVVKLVKACLRARKDRESRFHLCGSLVKLVKASLSARTDRESRFHH